MRHIIHVTNVSACDGILMPNVATLTEQSSGEQASLASSVELTGSCLLICPLSKGYWKNHPDNVELLLPQWLGNDQVVALGEAIGILGTGGRNGIDKLRAQLLTAELNLANGVNCSIVTEVMDAAQAFLSTHLLDDWWELDKVQQGFVLDWVSALDEFNIHQCE